MRRFDMMGKEKAFLDGCPSCGAPVEKYEAKTATTHEFWKFRCYCELELLPNGDLDRLEDCMYAMDEHLGQLESVSEETA